MLTVTKRLRWSMGHHLPDEYEGACHSPHGHDYVAELTFTCQASNAFGMVIDFGDIKKYCERWIKGHLDHRMMVQDGDMALERYLVQGGFKKCMVCFVPTVENMTPWLALELDGCLRSDELDERGVCLVALRVYETPDSWCDWRRDG